MGLNFDQLFPGRFLKSGQFKGKDVTLTIKAVRLEELEGDKGKKLKPIVSFNETPFELVANRTNGEAIKAMWGKECDAWLGKRLTLWPMPFHDNMTGEDTTAIRVRGSPDLAADMTFELKLARKKPVTVRLLKTAAKSAAAPAPAPAPGSAPQPFVPPTPEEIAANERELADNFSS